MTIYSRLGRDLLHLIAPALCPSCDAPLSAAERHYCAACRASLEPAPFPREIYQELAGAFGGDELALAAIGSLYAFRSESPVQALIHAVKYRGCRDLGVELGRELGGAMSLFRLFENADAVIPVPQHRARRRERGYNQAEAVAKGVAEVFGLPVESSLLLRGRHARSQTRLTASERKANIRDAFAAGRNGAIDGGSFILCDDVCTTGATLNMCGEVLLASGAARVAAMTVAKDMSQGDTGASTFDMAPFIPA